MPLPAQTVQPPRSYVNEPGLLRQHYLPAESRDRWDAFPKNRIVMA